MTANPPPPQPDLNPQIDHHVVLPDGRALAYATYGDPTGAPLVYFHGHPGSRLEAAILHEAAEAAGVLVIGTDRPGMGRSDFQRRRSLVDWPADITSLADHLGFDRFNVLGISGGGPYAAACARYLPGRVDTCVLIASASPAGLDPATDVRPDSGSAGVGAGGGGDGSGRGTDEGLAANRLQARLVRYAPWLLRPGFAALGRSIRRQVSNRGYVAAANTALEALPPVDRVAMSEPSRAARYGRSLAESFRQGARGAAWDARLLSRPWGFRLGAIDGPRVHVWHGELDRNVPFVAGQAMVEAIPDAVAHFHPDHGHLSVAVANLDEILSIVSGPATARNAAALTSVGVKHR